MRRSAQRGSGLPLAALVAATLLLTGCHSMHHRGPGDGPGPGGPKGPWAQIGDRKPHFAPEIKVEQGRIVVVTPPILVYLPGERDVEIVWKLPADSPWRFLPDGIVVDGQLTDRQVSVDRERAVVLDPQPAQQQFSCKAREAGLVFVCINRNSDKRGGVFKYTIRLTDGKSPPLVLDPPIVNWPQ